MNHRFARIGRGRPLQLLCAAALLFLLPAGGMAAPAPASLPADDVYFLPDGTQIVGQVRIGHILASEALKQFWAAFPGARKAFDEYNGKMPDGGLKNIERVVYGVTKVDFTAQSPVACVMIIHLKNSIKADDVEAVIKANGVRTPYGATYSFTDTKVGKYTMTQVKETPPPPFNPREAGPPTPYAAFAMPNDTTIVMGSTEEVQAILTRDRKPELGDRLQAVMKQTDFDADAALAVNVKDGIVVARWAGERRDIDDVNALSLTVKIAADVEVSLTATCPDAKAAAAVSGHLKEAFADSRGDLARTPSSLWKGAGEPPQELIDLLDVTPHVSESTVNVQKTIRTTALIVIITKSGSGGPLFDPPNLHFPGRPAPPASFDK